MENNKIKAPYGVIFQSDKKVIVGVNHVKPLIIDEHTLQKIKECSHGKYFYEGAGGDKFKVNELFGHIKYVGSWDEMIKPPTKKWLMCYTIFSTIGTNTTRLVLALTDKTGHKSILDMLCTSGNKFLHEMAKGYMSKMNWVTFLKACGGDIYKMSNMKASSQNVSAFIQQGTLLMWPPNLWHTYSTPAGKIAFEMSKVRDTALINFSDGVYFTGCGHLVDILKLGKASLKMVGGELISS